MTQLSDYQVAIRLYEQTPEWKDRAASYRRSHPPVCQACGARTRLDCHHVEYTRAFDIDTRTGRVIPLAQEWDDDLRGVCRRDHDRIHALTRHPMRMSLRDATDHVIQGRTVGRHPSFQPAGPTNRRPKPYRRKNRKNRRRAMALLWLLAVGTAATFTSGQTLGTWIIGITLAVILTTYVWNLE
jgi:ribosomal protein L20